MTHVQAVAALILFDHARNHSKGWTHITRWGLGYLREPLNRCDEFEHAALVWETQRPPPKANLGRFPKKRITEKMRDELIALLEAKGLPCVMRKLGRDYYVMLK